MMEVVEVHKLRMGNVKEQQETYRNKCGRKKDEKKD